MVVNLDEWLSHFLTLGWNWDFKNCYLDQNKTYPDKSIALYLMYKSYKLKSTNHQLNYTGKSGKNADCDKEAYPIYNILGWQTNYNSRICGETMNSFKTHFNHAIWLSENKDIVISEIGNNTKNITIEYDILLENNNYLKFELLSKFEKEFEKFAILTHTIGNFMTIPSFMNSGKGISSTTRDYFDIFLMDLYEFISDDDYWKKIVDKYILHPYVDENYRPIEFWEGHFKTYKSAPKNSKQIGQFLEFVNNAIEIRGKYIIDKLNGNITEGEFPNFGKKIK